MLAIYSIDSITIIINIVAPMAGGMLSAAVLTLIIFPVVHAVVKEISLWRDARKLL